MLKYPNRVAPRIAALALACSDARAVPALIEALEIPNRELRLNAIRTLGKIGGLRAVSALLDFARTNKITLSLARDVWQATDSEEALPILMEALDDEVGYVRACAARALGRFEKPHVVQALSKLVEDEEFQVREAVLNALVEIGNTECVTALISMLKDDSEHIHWLTIQGLAYLRDAHATPALIGNLSDKNSKKIWKAAIFALGRIGDSQAVPRLLDVLGDEDADLRRFSARALGDIGDQRAVSILKQSLHDEDHLVREAATIALGNVGDQSVVLDLVEALQDKDGNVRRYAALALKEVGDIHVIPDLEQVIEHDYDFMVLEACKEAIEHLS